MGEVWKWKREGRWEEVGSNGVEYGGVGSINGQIFKRGPAGSGRVNLINRATVPRQRSVAHATLCGGVRRVCPNFKNDRNTYLVWRMHMTVCCIRNGPSLYPSVATAE